MAGMPDGSFSRGGAGQDGPRLVQPFLGLFFSPTSAAPPSSRVPDGGRSPGGIDHGVDVREGLAHHVVEVLRDPVPPVFRGHSRSTRAAYSR